MHRKNTIKVCSSLVSMFFDSFNFNVIQIVDFEEGIWVKKYKKVNSQLGKIQFDFVHKGENTICMFTLKNAEDNHYIPNACGNGRKNSKLYLL